MRNRLIHSYYDVNLDIVWDTLQDELPDLVASLKGVWIRLQITHRPLLRHPLILPTFPLKSD